MVQVDCRFDEKYYRQVQLAPEALKGDHKGQHSIRINAQWRVCFVWTAEGPKNVKIVDYH